MLVVEVVGVEEPRVDEVGRLSLHGSRQFARAFWEEHAATDKGTVEGELEAAHAHETEVFAQVYLCAVTESAVGVLVGIGQVGAARYGIGPFDGVAEMLVEQSDRDDLAFVGGIELIAQVCVLDTARLQVHITLHIARQLEVVIDRWRHLAELGAVDRHAVGGAELVVGIHAVGGVERGEEVGGRVVCGEGRVLAVAGVAH